MKLFFKGFLMGAADIIPGISGGTVALLLGIYQEFIQSLAEIDLKPLFRFQLKKFLVTINWKFFIPLGLGIIIAIFSLSHLLSWLLSNHPVYVWSLFFGLVFASVLFLIKKYECYKLTGIIFIAIGFVIGLSITTMGSIYFPENPPFLLLGGILASMAMILPGISGSYILVLIGLYQPVLQAVKGLNLFPLSFFVLGVGIGVLLGSKVLKKLFARYPLQVYSILFGFILGSLPKIWPWHSVSAGPILPQLASREDLLGLGIMLIASIFVIASMRLTQEN